MNQETTEDLPSHTNDWIKPIAASVIGSVIGALVTSALQAPWWAVTLIFLVTGTWAGTCAYYAFLIASGSSTLRGDRSNYLNLRRRLREGGMIGQAYDASVEKLLSISEWIFGDRGRDKPNWTNQSLDRCVLFACLYPIFAILLIWALSGETGSTSSAIGLPDGLQLPSRIGPFILMTLIISGYFSVKKYTDGSRKGMVIRLISILILFSFIVSLIISMHIIIGYGDPVNYVLLALFSFFFANGFQIGKNSGFLSFVLLSGFAFIDSFLHFAGIIFLLSIQILLPKRLILPAVICSGLCLLMFAFPDQRVLDPEAVSNLAPVVLFLPLMAMINAPMDWLSLGITRKLLRQGLGQSNWKPIGLAALDLACALLCLCVLAILVLLLTQTFNAQLLKHGHAIAFDPLEVLMGVSDPAQRWESQYWWIYVMIFSTFLPSLCNLIVGSTAILRGFTPLNEWTLRQLPESGQVTLVWRWMMPAALATIRVATIALASITLTGFLYLVLVVIMPAFGLGLLEMLINLAHANVPARLILA